MTTPTPRLDSGPLTNAGPSQSVLQKLLEEINGSQHETERTTRRPSQPTSIRSLGRRDSVWVHGGSIAEEAREKLRAAGQAHQRRKLDVVNRTPNTESPRQLRRHSTKTGIEHEPAQSAVSVRRASTYSEINFSNQTTGPSQDSISPAGSGSGNPSNAHHSPPPSPDPEPKRPCLGPSHECDAWTHCDSHTDPGPSSAAISRTSTFTERDPSRGSIDSIPMGIARKPTLSSFRPSVASPQGHYEFTTPRQDSRVPVSSPSPSPTAPTPAWSNPFHLVDDGKSVFKNVHGEDWKTHYLCLNCFRSHSTFHRILEGGCEVCGHKAILNGHYWEQMSDPY